MKTNTLSGNDLSLVVARAEGISVEMRRGHVAVRLPFSPEGPAHDFEVPWMWRFYDPSTDDAIAGPIIDRCKISTQYSDGTWSGFYRSDSTLLNVYSSSRLEAAMRIYCMMVFGDDVDLDAPYYTRTAIVRVQGITSLDDYSTCFDRMVEVDASTTKDAEDLAVNMIECEYHDRIPALTEAKFIKWKDD